MISRRNQRIIFIPIEIKNREFYPKLLFSSYCLKKNFSVFFGSKKSVLRAVNKFSPGIYFHKSINYSDFDFIKKIKAKKNFYVSLDEEGGFAFSTKNDLNKLNMPFNVCKKVLPLIPEDLRYFNLIRLSLTILFSMPCDVPIHVTL